MNKREFLDELRCRLSELSDEDIVRSLDFYSEMIDDRVEDGLSEEVAVKDIGTPSEIAAQILATTPRKVSNVEHRAHEEKNIKLSGGVIALLILGAPVWLPLIIAAASVILSAYAVIWSVVITLYASSVGVFLGGIGIILFSVEWHIFMLGLGLLSMGLAIFLFFGCNALAKAVVRLTGFIIKKIAVLFKGRSEA